MRIYLLLFFITGMLFQSQAQTKNPVQQPSGNLGDGSTGTLELTEEDESGEIAKEKIPDSMYVYSYTQVMPAFPGGGDTAFYSFVRKNLIYPEDAKNNKITGAVYVKFIVEKNGSLSSIQVMPGKGISPSCDKAAIDVVSKSPKWIPGKNNGSPVRVQCIRRIKFEI